MDSSGSEHVPLAGSCKYGNEPSGSIKGKEVICITGSFSRTLPHGVNIINELYNISKVTDLSLRMLISVSQLLL
jgi:hypothetical protein